MKNSLYYGDNLEVLRKHIRDETIDLCYIDPPFNSNRNYNQIYNNIGHEDRAQAQAFVDTWTWDAHANECFEGILSNTNNVQTGQSIELIQGLERVLGRGSLFAYLVSMTARIAEIQRTLKTTGSFYLHCDPTASHYLKLICDAVFVPQGGDYRNEIVWRRTNAHNKLSRQYGPIHDVIFFYVKSSKTRLHIPRRPYLKSYIISNFPYEDDRGYFQSNVLTGSGTRTGDSGKVWRGYNPTPKNRHWAIPGKLSAELGIDVQSMKPQDILDLLDEMKLILHPKRKGSLPRYKQYLDSSEGVPLQDIWAYQPGTAGLLEGTDEAIDQDVKWLDTEDEKLDYPTQKPEGLLGRVISASSNEGDTILDAYCGCGTTIAVAQHLKRRWIGIDITYQSIALILRRLEETYGKKVLDDITLNGIPQDMESAVALAHKRDDRVRKEFEKWAVLTYTNNRAIISDKKGADRGIDGTAFFMTSRKENAKIIFQVKSGHVKRSDVATLRGDMQREKASMAVLITLERPSKQMTEEAKAAGQFHHAQMGRSYDTIQIVTVQEMIEQNKRLDIPMSHEVLKAAQRKALGEQPALPAFERPARVFQTNLTSRDFSNELLLDEIEDEDED